METSSLCTEVVVEPGTERYLGGYVPRARSGRLRYSFGSTVYALKFESNSGSSRLSLFEHDTLRRLELSERTNTVLALYTLQDFIAKCTFTQVWAIRFTPYTKGMVSF